jgi:hypothetical protein
MADISVTRRDFTRRLSLGAGLALAGGAGAVAQEQPSQDPGVAGAQEPPQPAEPPPPEPEDFQLAALVREYPSENLTDEMLAGIRAGLRRNRQQAAQLRAAGLANGDEPAFVFRAYRKE